MATPHFDPIDPSKPLPPIVAGKQTGVKCPSPKCFNQKPHSTIFYNPTKQPNAPLIGIRCPSRNYLRTYYRSIYSESLCKHNQQFAQVNKRKREQSDLRNRDNMDLQDLMNDDVPDAFLPFTPASQVRHPPRTTMPKPATSQSNPATETQAGTTLMTGGQCQGYLGRTGDGHSGRRNNQCAIRTCFECCRQLNPGAERCHTHSAQAKAKVRAKGKKPQATGLRTEELPPIQPTNLSEDVPEVHQGSGVVYKRMCNESNTFRSLALHRQAEERRANEAIEKSNCTVTMVVWAATGSNPIDCEMWREYIPTWPRFTMNDSQDLMELVQRELGEPNNQRLKVWSDAEEAWLGLRLNVLETFPEDCRRILIMFPDVDRTKCKQLEQQIALVRTYYHKPAINLGALGRPDPGCPTPPELAFHSSSTAAATATPPSSPLPQMPSPDSSPDIQVINFSVPINQPDTPEAKVVQTFNSFNTIMSQESTVTNVIPERANKWPTDVKMQVMLEFLHLSSGPKKLNIPTSWNRLFGGQGWHFVFPTASLYRRWLIESVEDGLYDWVTNNPNSVVQDALNQFDSAWGRCKSKKKKPQDPIVVQSSPRSSQRSRK
ncbi:hypothetical protein DFH28DRAFT_911096 [Melampsora americana]|nr:hypothetical protein DFH28DRAFT_911096 [Melampsora americana]